MLERLLRLHNRVNSLSRYLCMESCPSGRTILLRSQSGVATLQVTEQAAPGAPSAGALLSLNHHNHPEHVLESSLSESSVPNGPVAAPFSGCPGQPKQGHVWHGNIVVAQNEKERIIRMAKPARANTGRGEAHHVPEAMPRSRHHWPLWQPRRCSCAQRPRDKGGQECTPSGWLQGRSIRQHR